MKTIAVSRPSEDLQEVLDASTQGRVLVKRGGKPVAVVINVQDKDEEQIQLENDPQFWRMIQERRQERTIPWEQVKADLGLNGKKKARPRGARSRTRKTSKR